MAQQRVVFDPELLLLIVAGVFLVAIGLYVALEVRSRFRNKEGPVPEAASLDHYRDLRDQGLIDAAEFERVRLLFERRAQVGKVPEDSRPVEERFRVVDGRVEPPSSPRPPEAPPAPESPST
jgi:hypothetical protein